MRSLATGEADVVWAAESGAFVPRTSPSHSAQSEWIAQHPANHGASARTARRDCQFLPRRISFVEMFLNRLAHGLKDFHPSTIR
jgi:hypothetical protein